MLIKKLLTVGCALGILSASSLAAEPQRYKTVDAGSDPGASSNNTSSDSGDYFKGEPLPTVNNLFVGAGLDYFDSFGVQGRYAYRVLDKGPAPEINNSLYIEGGFGLTFYGNLSGQSSSTTGFDMILTARWDFQLNTDFIFFADLGLGYNAVSNNNSSKVHGGGVFPALGVGAMYNINPEWAVRADLSYQFLGLGVTRRF